MTPRAARSCATVVDVLRACEEWFDGHPERWHSAYPAINVAGVPGSVHSPLVFALSALGASGRFCEGDGGLFRGAQRALERTVPGGNVCVWERAPDRTHADIVAAFRAAREREERRDG